MSKSINIYCLKCKSKTETNKPYIKKNDKGKHFISGTCKICNHKKSQFIKGGDVQSAITNLFPGIEFHHRTLKDGKIVKHNFTGPGTNLDKRIKNKDVMVDELIDNPRKSIEDILKGGTPNHNDDRVLTKPIDTLDESSFRHDIRYDIVDKVCKDDKNCKKKGRRVADKQMIDELSNNIKRKDVSVTDKIQSMLAKHAMRGKIAIEHFI